MSSPELKYKIDHVLFSCDSHHSLADSIMALPEAKRFIQVGKIQWDRFEDGFPNLMINSIEIIRSRHCVVLVDFFHLEKIFEQLSVIFALPRYFIKSLTIVLPYFPTGTMERIDEEGQIATAMTLARLLSATPPTSYGPSRVVIYDIHALQERFYFGDNVVPILSSAIPVFVEQLTFQHSLEKIAIAFPDEGAWKRFHKHFVNMDYIICTKVRDGDKRIVTVGEGKEFCSERHVFIVDDLIKTGGTIIECNRALRKFGATHVSAFVTHAIFPGGSWKKFTEPKESDPKFDIFYLTNSCPIMANQLRDIAPFKVLELAPSIVTLLASHRFSRL